jgi:PIN domain nuclease of toxin-antitoxin system
LTGMSYLLDTHVFLWMQAQPERIGSTTRALLEDPSIELYLSAASSWEIAIKFHLGKLSVPDDPSVYVPDRMASSGIRGLPIEHAHALAVEDLEPHHRDPFDRLLVAQAQTEGLTLVSSDSTFEAYDVAVQRADG